MINKIRFKGWNAVSDTGHAKNLYSIRVHATSASNRTFIVSYCRILKANIYPLLDSTRAYTRVRSITWYRVSLVLYRKRSRAGLPKRAQNVKRRRRLCKRGKDFVDLDKLPAVIRPQD